MAMVKFDGTLTMTMDDTKLGTLTMGGKTYTVEIKQCEQSPLDNVEHTFDSIPTVSVSKVFQTKESKDEIIRKDLIAYFHGSPLKCPEREVIAWLEKQKAIDILDAEERDFADNVDSYRKEVDAAYQKGYNEGVKATLEKQGEHMPSSGGYWEGFCDAKEKYEQKSADKVEPKFREGDWVVIKQ